MYKQLRQQGNTRRETKRQKQTVLMEWVVTENTFKFGSEVPVNVAWGRRESGCGRETDRKSRKQRL